MSARRGQSAGPPSAPRVLMSLPWIVVFLGVGLLTALLVIALASVRGEEHRVVPTAVDPPIYLPTLGVESTPAMPAGSPAPLAVATSASPAGSPSARPSPSRTPTPRSIPAPPPASAAVPRDEGTVTARYQPTASGRGWFEAQLTVTNGSGHRDRWKVTLYFAGNVKSVQASASSGLSVSGQGSGVFVLAGSGTLAPERSVTVQLRFVRTGTGDRPGRCTVNGTDCVIG